MCYELFGTSNSHEIFKGRGVQSQNWCQVVLQLLSFRPYLGCPFVCGVGAVACTKVPRRGQFSNCKLVDVTERQPSNYRDCRHAKQEKRKKTLQTAHETTTGRVFTSRHTTPGLSFAAVLRTNKAASQIGTNVTARVFNADSCLVVSLHPEGPATGQLDQGFPWFSLVPERMLSSYPNSTLHCMLLMQPSKY
jgi:hypothetical protein